MPGWTLEVRKMGLAARWLGHKREGRKEMKLELDVGMIHLLNGMIRMNGLLPLGAAGGNPQNPLPLYKAPDEAAQRQMVALQKWVEKRLLVKKRDDGKSLDYPELGDGETVSVSLRQAYIDRIKELMKHYEKIGQLSQMVEPYLKLKDALDGKKFEYDEAVEDVEEVGKED